MPCPYRSTPVVPPPWYTCPKYQKFQILCVRVRRQFLKWLLEQGRLSAKIVRPLNLAVPRLKVTQLRSTFNRIFLMDNHVQGYLPQLKQCWRARPPNSAATKPFCRLSSSRSFTEPMYFLLTLALCCLCCKRRFSIGILVDLVVVALVVVVVAIFGFKTGLDPL